MPIIGWIRDLFGILNDAQAAKKTRLEIEKMEDEKREKLITPATLEDVKKYDPKIRRIERGASRWKKRRVNYPRSGRIEEASNRQLYIVLLIILILILLALFGSEQ